jgi:hypothetical protein
MMAIMIRCKHPEEEEQEVAEEVEEVEARIETEVNIVLKVIDRTTHMHVS